ncbi:type III secretion system export apparatus subunit SctT [Acetobacter thailandicus]|uniref:type III secretion system export apparatus subunit SctT n=1 Tax=Acetobacter thailandicus TaxID=1502842 RepID=UPI001BA84D0F|nr:type III secretion system export apparatus subunit SctT [Acetobacter thailandicus]MBS0979522.1 type III secretion system export apparatus subunit SctT [Acetobacter thailandicus]
MSAPADLMQNIMPWLSALAISMSRPAGVAVVLPVFTRAQLGGPVRGAIAFALGLPVTPSVYEKLTDTSHSLIMLGLLSAKELMIGIIIGFILGLPVWGVQCAGEMLDTQRSATQGQSEDPASGNQDSITAGFLAMAVITLFVVSGGLNLVAGAILSSESLWPPTVLNLSPQPGATTVLLTLLDQLELITLTTGAPVMLAMLLCEFSIILLMRAIPKLHLYDLAPNLRNLAFTLMIFSYCSWLVVYMKHDLVAIHHVTGTLNTLLQP